MTNEPAHASDKEFELRGELNKRLADYAAGRADAEALASWLRSQPVEDLADPLRRDLAALQMTAEAVTSAERDEQELRDHAKALLPPNLG